MAVQQNPLISYTTMPIEKKEKLFGKRGFSLIELIVAMSIFAMVMIAMIAVSVSGFRSYIKSKAMKNVSEDVGFAVNSMIKDIRMGRVESDNSPSVVRDQIIITRNSSQERVRYKVFNDKLTLCDCTNDACSDTATENCKNMVEFPSSTGLTFDLSASGSGFRNRRTASALNIRGWVEINLNIESYSMETDSIRVQTIVSSRDYGWDEVP